MYSYIKYLYEDTHACFFVEQRNCFLERRLEATAVRALLSCEYHLATHNYLEALLELENARNALEQRFSLIVQYSTWHISFVFAATSISVGLHSAQDGGAALLESADVPSSAANLKLFLWMRSYLRQLTLKCTVYFQHVLLGEELAAAAPDVRDAPTPSASRSASRSSLTGSTLSVGSSQSRPARVSSLIEHSALQRLIDEWHRKQPQLAARTSLHVVNVLRAASATGGPVQPAANWSAFARVASGYQVPLVDAAAWEFVARELSAPAAAAPAIIAQSPAAARQISSGSNASVTSTLTRTISDSNGGGEQAGRLLAGIATEMEDFVTGGFQRYSFVFSHPPVGSYRVARLLTFTPVTRASTVTDESKSLECRRRRSCSARVTRRARARSRRLARRSRRSCSAGARS